MKKFYAFLAAALMSVSVFAAKDVVPSDATIMAACGGEVGQVVVGIFVPADMACFDVIFVGTYNNWGKGEGTTESAANCKKFEAIEGYDGWYAVAVDDESESPEGKPLMLDIDGNFNWAYQVGAATVIRGGVTVVAGGIAGEIDLKTYGKDAPNVFTVDAWKSNPCTAVYHNYNVQVISAGCDNLAVPFIIGGMNNWNAQEMQIDVAKTKELQVPVYYLNFKAAEGTEYQLLSGLRDPQTQKIDSTAQPGWYDDAYLQVLVDDVWSRYEPSNSKLGTEVSVVYDLRLDTIRWARCAPAEPEELVGLQVKLPAENCPEAVEVIGTFDGWAGTALAFNASTGYYTAEFAAKPSQFFKFRSAGAWPDEGGTEIEVYRDDDDWSTIQDNELVFKNLWKDGTCSGEPCKTITLDFSGENYRWKAIEQGIENVTLTEKAHKVMVDGVMYIIRDNKMFNVQGTQVR